jgi:hypothetical protein
VKARQDWEREEWLDRQAVEDLIHRYSDSVTRGDHERTATLFAPDAVWVEVGGARLETARECVHYLVEGSASLELLIQTPHSPVVEFRGLDAPRRDSRPRSRRARPREAGPMSSCRVRLGSSEPGGW